jgi:hypothetical protein
VQYSISTCLRQGTSIILPLRFYRNYFAETTIDFYFNSWSTRELE